ncbi:PREDICTED: G2/mitotic-specific cyclin-B2-like, partial [Rhagoletis zephyria]|uniref:G2/mitotic-specific cyclin-B2-like n=1 Tax=Rhagoletis zephyria TaxID=28612 RepID=UPI00081174FB
MIIAGDYIDLTLGVTLGISTMAAAGLGNALSDVAGVGSAYYVERIADKKENQKENNVPGSTAFVNKFRKECKVSEKPPAVKQKENQKENNVPGSTAFVSKFRKECKVSEKPPAVKQVIENIDKDYNCYLLSDYAADIYKYLRELEEKQSLKPNFLAIKNTVQPNMRSILINWILQVHQSFNLAPETLYICVSIIDRFLARELVQKTRLQLVGVTALFIASKYEEIYYPEIGQFVDMCDKLYTKRDIIKMELEILGKLKFELGRPLPLHFLRRISKAAKADGRTHMLAKYLCELTLVEYECAHWNPSLLAATALYLSLRLMELEKNGSLSPLSVDAEAFWTPTIEHYSGYK